MTMSDDGDRTCPLCAEEMDITDQQLKPCKCGYEVLSSSLTPPCPACTTTRTLFHCFVSVCMRLCRFVSGAGTTSLTWLRKRTQRGVALPAAHAMTRTGLLRWLQHVTGNPRLKLSVYMHSLLPRAAMLKPSTRDSFSVLVSTRKLFPHVLR